MAETSKNKIYYNDDENSVADVLTDMKKLAQSTDDAIEKSKYDDTQIKKDITNIKAKDTEQDSKIVELQTEKAELEKELKEAQEDIYQNSIRGQASGEYIHVEDSSNCRANLQISGNSEQETRSGKNKLEFINGTYTDKNVTAVVKDGVITLNGNPSSTSFVVIDEDFNYTFKANQRYTISLNNSNIINSDEAKFRFSNGTTIIKDINFNSANKKETFYFTEDTLASNITIRTGTAITYNNFVIKPQLELEETASEWEQGGASPSPDYPSEVECCGDNGSINEVICNKNLFDKNTTTDGKYIGNNGSIQTQSNIMYSDYIQIKTNINYYITGRSEWASVALYDKNKTFLERISTTQPNGVLNITNSNCKYIIINALLTNKDTLQLEEGASTSYEPHQEQSYIMPTQREMLEGDYFDFDNEEEVHTWNKLVLNGTESWTYNSIENLFYIILENSDLSVSSNIHCTHFKSVLYNVVSNENNCITASGIMLILKKNDISNLEDFISYLKSQYDARTPVVIYYKLATPEKLAFTDEQKAVAKELNNARTYKNVTNITTDSKAILSLDYAKDLETLLTSKESEV